MSVQNSTDEASTDTEQLHEGEVVFVSEESDLFGFVAVDEYDEDVFFHIEDDGVLLERATDVSEGDEVVVRVKTNPKGLTASHLEVAPEQQLDLDAFENLRVQSRKVFDVTIGVGRLNSDSPQVRLYEYGEETGVFAYTDGTRSEYYTISRRELENPFVGEYFENEFDGLDPDHEELLVEMGTNTVGVDFESVLDYYDFEYRIGRTIN